MRLNFDLCTKAVRSNKNVTEGTMSDEDKMTIDERRKYLRMVKKRYLQTNKVNRGQLLDEMEAVTGLHRKSLIRLMASDMKRKLRRRHRGRQYGAEVDDALRIICESFDYPCAERLQSNLVWMAKQLAGHGELTVSEQLEAQLSRISVSTVKRILGRIQQDKPRLPRRKPSRGNAFAKDIPMRQIAWNEHQPGHFEVDMVHHSGPSSSGQYIHSLQMIDVATGWSERVATLGRSYRVMEDAFRRAMSRLPFPVLEIHPDNGSEFFNSHLLHFFKEQAKIPELSRSRPYHKNDNRFVEQKNSTLIRDPLGYDRFDTVTHTLAINQLYDLMWLYYNFFQPVMRIREKIILPTDGRGSRIKRRYDQARTPLDRLCATDAISQAQKDQLLALREQTNPRKLRQTIYDQIDAIFRLPGAQEGVTEDIFQTLAQPIQIPKGADISVTLLFEPITFSR
jgi:hypothetical protein